MKNLGKRKCAIATIEIVPGTGIIKVNNVPDDIYFQKQASLISVIWSPIEKTEIEKNFNIFIRVNGGGMDSQAHAIKLGIAKTLNEEFIKNLTEDKELKENLLSISPTNAEKNRSLLKKENYLTRDPRVKERRKYGLKKARKSSQFSKR